MKEEEENLIIKKPLSFVEWKQEKNLFIASHMEEAMKRLYDIDIIQEYENNLHIEYEEYLKSYNARWLLD